MHYRRCRRSPGRPRRGKLARLSHQQRGTVANSHGHSRIYMGVTLAVGIVGAVAAVLALFVVPEGSTIQPSQVEPTSPSPTTGTASPSASPRTMIAAPEVTPPPPVLVGDVPVLYVGNWVGTIDQQQLVGSDSTYPARLHVVGGVLGEVVGSSSYPTLECHADLLLVEASEARLVVEEKLRTTGMCLDNVLITLNPSSDGTLRYAVASADAAGVVRRTS